jgi:maltooligosyltrehalose trehalohydrolase
MSAVDVRGSGSTIVLRRWSHDEEIVAVFHLGTTAEDVEIPAAEPVWRKLLDSADEQWLASGSAVTQAVQARDGAIHIELGPKQCVVLAGSTGLKETSA